VPALNNITRRDQIAAIADDSRLLILRLLMKKPQTLTHLANTLETYPAKIRYHVKKLEDVGLIQLIRTEKTLGYVEKYYKATASAYAVHFMVVPEHGATDAAVIAYGDAALDSLTSSAQHSGENVYSPIYLNSLDGLVALKQNLADVAACHLLDKSTGEYNAPFVERLFPGRPMILVTLAHREQGLVVAEGNPLSLRSIEDLARPGIRFVNREPDSGTRIWLDSQLTAANITQEQVDTYSDVVPTHAAVAEKIAAGEADVGIATLATAREAGLGFIPLFHEQYDLVFDAEKGNDPHIVRLLEALTTRSFRQRTGEMGGYDMTHVGRITRVG